LLRLQVEVAEAPQLRTTVGTTQDKTLPTVTTPVLKKIFPKLSDWKIQNLKGQLARTVLEIV